MYGGDLHMARNKYPEITVEKILEVSQRLFLTKGYDNTTIQDIVDELGGLTRGAIYHHFKSKEEIMDALTNKMFREKNPFDTVKNQKDLNGLQKMKMAMSLNQSDKERVNLSLQAMPILKNPRILAGIIESNRQVLSPFWLELLTEGIKDGSIHTDYARELSELIPLFDLWLTPSIYPATSEEIFHKFLFIKDLFDKMGLPLIDDEIMETVKKTLVSMEV
jgi:AcrR family transcriptional regulator